MEPRSLDQTVNFFRELGEDEKAGEIIDLYIGARREEIELFDPGEYSYFGDIKDQLIRDKFTAFYVSVHLPLCKRGIEGDLSNKISPSPSFPKRGTEHLPFYQASAISENAEQVLERIATQRTLNGKDEIILSNASVEQYYELLKSEKGRCKHRAFLSSFKKFAGSPNVSDSQKEIVSRVTEALKRIATERKINEIRVKEYGIQ